MLYSFGQLAMVQTVLSSIPTYHLYLFKIPNSIAEEFGRKMRNFLWVGNDIYGVAIWLNGGGMVV